VQIEADALQVCITHALSTEKEEVMGLLIGEVDENISHVYTVIVLKRSDKRKDRVEISPEQLSQASTEAEQVGLLTRAKRPMRIIGWYHSHPHITVWPSHVDVRTQAMYQLMDSDFIGLIVSCFSNDQSNAGKVQVTCFQSTNVAQGRAEPRYERLEIELEVVPCKDTSTACLKALRTSAGLLVTEECERYRMCLGYEEQDLITAVQNATVYAKSMMEIIEIVCSPMLHNFELEVKRKKKHIEELKLKLYKLKNEEEPTRATSGTGTCNSSDEMT